VRPSIGIRAKLTTRHAGHWGSTSGDKAKFGLRAREIVGAVNTLAEEGMLDCLNLLHFHVGSQITNIRMVKEVMREASFLYAELVQMGATMRFIDCGGGLAVDYDGSFTDSHASMSYTLQHYANDVVSAVQEVCIQRSIPPPTIITESGRALASHASVLVFDVLNTPECLHEKRVEQEEVVESIEIRDDKPLTKQLRAAARSGKGKFLLMTFKEVYDNITADAFALREAYNDASYFKDEGVRAFKLGVLSLEERAQVCGAGAGRAGLLGRDSSFWRFIAARLCTPGCACNCDACLLPWPARWLLLGLGW
jgi:arginine decarboxylase